MGLIALIYHDLYRSVELVAAASVANGDQVFSPVLLKTAAAWHTGLDGADDFHVEAPTLCRTSLAQAFWSAGSSEEKLTPFDGEMSARTPPPDAPVSRSGRAQSGA